jgi:hypothetical protein
MSQDRECRDCQCKPAQCWAVKNSVLTVVFWRIRKEVLFPKMVSGLPGSFTHGCAMPKSIVDYKSPPHKVVAFLRNGLDKLRVKYTALRVEFRRVENQVRAVTKSRRMWEQRARLAEAELAEQKKSR